MTLNLITFNLRLADSCEIAQSVHVLWKGAVGDKLPVLLVINQSPNTYLQGPANVRHWARLEPEDLRL